MTTQCRSALPAGFFQPFVLFVALESVSGLILTPIAVLAAVLGAWRFGAAPGWTNDASIASGLPSRYQLWFAVAIGAETLGFLLNRWVAKHKLDLAARKRIHRLDTRTPRRLTERSRGRQAELEKLLRNREEIAVDSSADMLDQIQHASERDMAVARSRT